MSSNPDQSLSQRAAPRNQKRRRPDLDSSPLKEARLPERPVGSKIISFFKKIVKDDILKDAPLSLLSQQATAKSPLLISAQAKAEPAKIQPRLSLLSTTAKAEPANTLSTLLLSTTEEREPAPGPQRFFEKPSIFVCPFAENPSCPHKTGCFESFDGVSQHIKLRHRGEESISYEQDQREDGTLKIPCPNGCGELFVSHQQANQHAKSQETCKSRQTGPFHCPWQKYNNCTKTTDNKKGMANHAATHKNDKRSPYVCQYVDCGVHHADLYMLAMHEERCKKRDKPPRQTCYRFRLDAAAERGEAPTVIAVARSSSHAPTSWKAGTGSIQGGIPLIGQSIVKEYAELTGTQPSSCVVHAITDCPTGKILPASS